MHPSPNLGGLLILAVAAGTLLGLTSRFLGFWATTGGAGACLVVLILWLFLPVWELRRRGRGSTKPHPLLDH